MVRAVGSSRLRLGLGGGLLLLGSGCAQDTEPSPPPCKPDSNLLVHPPRQQDFHVAIAGTTTVTTRTRGLGVRMLWASD